MQFQDRSKFIQAASSEKITLVTIDAKTRLYVFTEPSPGVFSKITPHFVAGLKQNYTNFTRVSPGILNPGEFSYDPVTSELQFMTFGGVAPTEVEIIVTYRFFYAEKGISLPWDLSDIGDDVFWHGRVVSSPGYKHKIGIDQALTSLVGEGTLQLKNQDGGLDDIFDTLIFENQQCTIYSWNPGLSPSDSRAIYRGSVTNKTFDGIDVKFKIKDQIFSLLDAPNINQYTESDNVAKSALGQFKRRVYGRVDGLQCQSVDQINEGILLTGSVSMIANSTSILGNGTNFLNEVLQDDKIIVGSQIFTVAEVVSNFEIVTTDEADFSFSGVPASVKPNRGTPLKNRTYIAAGHICAEVTHTIVNFPQFNRVVLSDTSGLFAGDFIEFNETAERIEIKNIAPDNVVVLQQNVVQKASVGTSITRRPVQEVYIRGERANANDYTVDNTSDCRITFNTQAEFNLANPKNTKFSGTFTNGSRIINITTSEIGLDDVFSPGDLIKPNDISYNTFYKIVNIKTSSLEINEVFADPTISDIIEIISPNYLDDESIVSVNILGKTVDGTATGVWISNVAQAQRDLIEDVGISTYNIGSFTEGEEQSPQLISMAIPSVFSTKVLPTTKQLVDNLSKSTNSSLTIDNDLLIKFKSLNVFTGENLTEIKDSDVIDWNIRSTNGKTFKRVFSRYRFQDIVNNTLEAGNEAFTFDSEFVQRYIGTNKVEEVDLYLYEARDAEIATHRISYINRLGMATLTITTDLRLENIEIGEVVIANFNRLYKRYGDKTYRKKAMLVVGKTLTGSRTELILSDLGNTFNTSSYITPNDAPEWSLANADQKLIYGYITDNQGIIYNEEDTAGIHLIS